MKTVQQILSLSVQYLQQKSIARARREAEDLLCDALSVSRVELYLHFDRPLQENELQRCRTYVKRRGQNEPCAYIHGEMDFVGCKIAVNRHVLIPRQETALLVDHISRRLKKERSLEGKVLWDICCGSGCIGIALKKQFPDLLVCVSDLCPEAVNMAKANASANQVEISAFCGDLFAPFAGEQCHYFVCNPPYVTEQEYCNLEPQVHDYEPRLALVAGSDGLLFYRRLAAGLAGYLFPHGQAFFELGSRQGLALLEIFAEDSWKKRHLEQDWAGHDRFFFLENE